MTKPISLLNGQAYHLLDHLIPLSHFLDCPLLVDDLKTYEMANRYYIDTDIRYEPIDLRSLANHYNCLIVSTNFASIELKSAFLSMNIDHMRFCFCPHGQSDKGLSTFAENAIAPQDIVLIYGKRQEMYIKELPCSVAPKKTILGGNFRLAYYQKYQKQLDQKIQDSLFSSFAKEQKTILYAPTWDDFEHSTSFFDTWESLIEGVPEKYNLIIKLHPLLEKNHPGASYRALSYHKCKSNVQVILEMPLIYPLLNRIDLYIGDYSAIGYDFLYFNRPLFFLGSKKVPLHEAGLSMNDVTEFLENLSDPQSSLQKKRELLYSEAFSPFSKNLLNPLIF